MQLKEWVNSHDPAARRAIREHIARTLGVSECAVRHWMSGIRRVPGVLCIRLERLTGRAVTRYELRPDIFGEGPVEGQGRVAPSLMLRDISR